MSLFQNEDLFFHFVSVQKGLNHEEVLTTMLFVENEPTKHLHSLLWCSQVKFTICLAPGCLQSSWSAGQRSGRENGHQVRGKVARSWGREKLVALVATLPQPDVRTALC